MYNVPSILRLSAFSRKNWISNLRKNPKFGDKFWTWDTWRCQGFNTSPTQTWCSGETRSRWARIRQRLLGTEASSFLRCCRCRWCIWYTCTYGHGNDHVAAISIRKSWCYTIRNCWEKVRKNGRVEAKVTHYNLKASYHVLWYQSKWNQRRDLSCSRSYDLITRKRIYFYNHLVVVDFSRNIQRFTTEMGWCGE